MSADKGSPRVRSASAPWEARIPRRGRAVAALACALAACRGSGPKTHRGSGAPVELVQAPVPSDAGAKGAVTEEIEPNDAADVATPLALGTTVRGKIESKSETEPDVDRYRIDIDKPGVLAVMVSGVDGQDLILEIEDAGGTVIAKSDRPGMRVKEGVPNLGVTPGRYTAVVRAVPKKKAPAPRPRPQKGKKGAAAPSPEPAAAPAPVYEISAQSVTPAASAEREPDDDRGTANDLLFGDAPVTGYVGWSDDRDVWKLAIETLSAKNAVDIEVSAIEGTALELEIADGIGTQIADRKAPRGAPLIVRGLLPVVPQGGAPFHYLTVRGSPSNPETAYQLRVTAHPIEVDAETEPNDTPERAFPFPPDRKTVYATWTPGDVDCYALAVSPNQRTVELIAKPTQGDLDLSLEVIVDGKSAATANKGGRGAEEKVSVPVPPGARAIVRVKNADAGATNEAKYELNVNDE